MIWELILTCVWFELQIQVQGWSLCSAGALLLLLITARHDEHQISLVNLPFDLTTHPTAP